MSVIAAASNLGLAGSVLRRSLVVGFWVAVTVLVAQACGGEQTQNPPPPSPVGDMAGEAGNATSRDTGGTAGKSSGIAGHGPTAAGGVAATAGAGQVAGAGGQSAVAATAGAT